MDSSQMVRSVVVDSEKYLNKSDLLRFLDMIADSRPPEYSDLEETEVDLAKSAILSLRDVLSVHF